MKKTNRRRRYGARKYSGKRVLNANKMDRATVIESHELAAVPEGAGYISHCLSDYARASMVAQNFRFYRCKKVELEFIPFANVFAPGTAFPELYYQTDRTQGTLPAATLPAPTKDIMLKRGCLPQKWTSPIKKSYSPSVLRLENLVQSIDANGNLTGVAGQTGTPVMYKWYATQQYRPTLPIASNNTPTALFTPESLRYFGAVYFVDQPLAAEGAVLGTIKMRVHWEFKQPLWLTDVSGTQIRLS